MFNKHDYKKKSLIKHLSTKFTYFTEKKYELEFNLVEFNFYYKSACNLKTFRRTTHNYLIGTYHSTVWLNNK